MVTTSRLRNVILTEFLQSLHTEVLDPLHVLLAIALELPEDYFTNIHKYEIKSEVGNNLSSNVQCHLKELLQDHLRYMKYGKFTPEENIKIGKLWGRGHTGMLCSRLIPLPTHV